MGGAADHQRRRIDDQLRPIAGPAVRELISNALTGSGITDASGKPLRFSPHDFRRILITDAIMHGMPPQIAQLVAGHRDISVTMGYKAVYPECPSGIRRDVGNRYDAG